MFKKISNYDFHIKIYKIKIFGDIPTLQICYYPTFISSRWLSVRLETVGNLVILFAALFAVLGRYTSDPGKVKM